MERVESKIDSLMRKMMNKGSLMNVLNGLNSTNKKQSDLELQYNH
jgi:hypothetical protein